MCFFNFQLTPPDPLLSSKILKAILNSEFKIIILRSSGQITWEAEISGGGSGPDLLARQLVFFLAKQESPP